MGQDGCSCVTIEFRQWCLRRAIAEKLTLVGRAHKWCSSRKHGMQCSIPKCLVVECRVVSEHDEGTNGESSSGEEDQGGPQQTTSSLFAPDTLASRSVLPVTRKNCVRHVGTVLERMTMVPAIVLPYRETSVVDAIAFLWRSFTEFGGTSPRNRNPTLRGAAKEGPMVTSGWKDTAVPHCEERP